MYVMIIDMHTHTRRDSHFIITWQYKEFLLFVFATGIGVCVCLQASACLCVLWKWDKGVTLFSCSWHAASPGPYQYPPTDAAGKIRRFVSWNTNRSQEGLKETCVLSKHAVNRSRSCSSSWGHGVLQKIMLGQRLKDLNFKLSGRFWKTSFSPKFPTRSVLQY